MYWPLLAAVALAVGYHQCGAMSVWVMVLDQPETVLLAVAVAALAVVGIVIRRRFDLDPTATLCNPQ